MILSVDGMTQENEAVDDRRKRACVPSLDYELLLELHDVENEVSEIFLRADRDLLWIEVDLLELYLAETGDLPMNMAMNVDRLERMSLQTDLQKVDSLLEMFLAGVERDFWICR